MSFHYMSLILRIYLSSDQGSDFSDLTVFKARKVNIFCVHLCICYLGNKVSIIKYSKIDSQ